MCQKKIKPHSPQLLSESTVIWSLRQGRPNSGSPHPHPRNCPHQRWTSLLSSLALWSSVSPPRFQWRCTARLENMFHVYSSLQAALLAVSKKKCRTPSGLYLWPEPARKSGCTGPQMCRFLWRKHTVARSWWWRRPPWSRRWRRRWPTSCTLRTEWPACRGGCWRAASKKTPSWKEEKGEEQQFYFLLRFLLWFKIVVSK